MVKDADLNAEEDKKEREKAEVRNEADSLIYVTEKSLNDYGDKVTDDDKKKIEDAAADLRKALESDNIEEIKSKNEVLKQASYKLAEEVYKSTAQNADSAQSASSGEQQAGTDGSDAGGSEADASSTDGKDESKDNVEDVDYEVVDEDDKKQ